MARVCEEEKKKCSDKLARGCDEMLLESAEVPRFVVVVVVVRRAATALTSSRLACFLCMLHVGLSLCSELVFRSLDIRNNPFVDTTTEKSQLMKEYSTVELSSLLLPRD